MKVQQFVEELISSKTFGPRHRIDRQVSAMRKESAFPKGTKAKKDFVEVTAEQAAKLILILTLNPSPHERDEFRDALNSIETLRPFLNDLARILASGGEFLGARRVESVRVSLDQPAAHIQFQDVTVVYGNEKELALERVAVISARTLRQLSYLMQATPQTGTFRDRAELHQQLSTEKI